MSDPTRYRVANNQAQLTLGGNILAVDPAGPLVDYADYARLKAEVERLNTGIQPEGSNDAVGRAVNVLLEKQKEIANLKAEVERLTSDIQMEKENEDRLVREWQKANNEVYGLKTQVAALIDDQTRLKAEVERLTKAGDAMADRLIYQGYPETVPAWNAAKEGRSHG